jgi:hypothetical protein
MLFPGKMRSAKNADVVLTGLLAAGVVAVLILLLFGLVLLIPQVRRAIYIII